jgi:hypothetical protein
MLNIPLFDTPTRSSGGFLIRYILPRMGPPALVGPLARNPFFNALARNSDFILGSGHGSNDSYTGQNVTDLLTIGKYNPDHVKGKVIKLVSCDTGQGLCQDLVNNGARAALGYDQDLIWVADESYYFNPWDDPQAKSVMLCIRDGLNALLDGATAQESLDIEKAAYMVNMDNEGRSFNRSILKWNYDHSVLFGDKNAVLSQRAVMPTPFFPPPPMIF